MKTGLIRRTSAASEPVSVRGDKICRERVRASQRPGAGPDGEDVEVDGPGPHLVGGEHVIARSRSFIPARLADNPDLARTSYAAVLAGLPDELRRAYRDGDF